MRSDTWYIAILLAISFLDVVLATWNRVCTPFTKSFGPHPFGICGNRIDEMLDVLCIGGYNEYPDYNGLRRKRDISEGHSEDLHGILIRRQEANSYLVKRSSFYERGIVCECCYHRCSVFELFSYCRGDTGLFGLFKRSVPEHKQSYRQNHSND